MAIMNTAITHRCLAPLASSARRAQKNHRASVAVAVKELGSVEHSNRTQRSAWPIAASYRYWIDALKKDSDEKIYEQTEKVVADLKDKWNKTEEKPAAIGLTVSALVALWVLNGVVGAVDKIPIISGVLELVGIFVTAWFVYRYLVFGPDREQLKRNLNDFWQKVQGKAKSVSGSGPKI